MLSYTLVLLIIDIAVIKCCSLSHRAQQNFENFKKKILNFRWLLLILNNWIKPFRNFANNFVTFHASPEAQTSFY